MSQPHYGYGEDMGLSLYFALGIFLLFAVRNPGVNRSLILFAGWSSFAHAAVMARLAMKTAPDQWMAVALLVPSASS